MKTQISRRSFLKGTLAGAVGVATTGILGACSEPAAGTTAAPGTDAPETTTAPETTAAPVVSEPVAETPQMAPFTQLNPQDESYDSYSGDVSAIFSPIQVGPLTLRNRIIKSAAGSDTLVRSEPGMAQNTLDYYGRMADGGAAMIVVESGCTNKFLTDAAGDEGIAEVKKLVDRIHQGGAYAATQFGIGSPLDAPGKVNEYTIDQIKDMVKGYGEYVRNMKKAGFDAVEMKGATTDGLNEFLTRRLNAREDEYGAQTEENRVRFFREIVEEMRAAAGDDMAVLVLINAIEESDVELGNSDKFIKLEEAKYVAKTLEEAGADLVQIRLTTGGQEANCWATDTNHCAYGANGTTGYGMQFDYSTHFDGLVDGAHSGCGAFIPLAREIKKAVSVPVGCASYMDPRTAPDMMNNAIKNGDVDLLFMTRALTVDPELPNKLQAGKRDEIAPCTRCFHCHDKAYTNKDGECCRVNATTQFAYKEFAEGYDTTPAETPKKIMVIGGGVAGLEAARIAAERGHDVTLYEKNGYLGGMLLFADAVKGPHERLQDLLAYLTRQQELKGVKVVTGQEVTVDFVKQENPDAVIVAVGGARESKVSGANVIDLETAYVKMNELPERILFLGAGVQAVDMAQHLLAMNKKITMVHEGDWDQVDKEQSPWVRKYVRAHMYAHGVRVYNESTVDAVNADSVDITMRAGVKKNIPCDIVVEAYDMIPNTTLADAIAKEGYEVHMAGCDAPKNFQSAIHAGYKAGRYI